MGSNLAGGKLAGTDLAGAHLYCCDLREIDLRAANLTNADLRGSSLKGARLYGARMDGVDLRDAHVAVVEASGLYRMWTVDPSRSVSDFGPDGVLRQGVDLRFASLKRARLGKARLKGADFSGANLSGADLAYADLRGCVFAETILTGVDLKHLRIDPAALATCILDPDAEAVAQADSARRMLDETEQWVDNFGRQGRVADLSGMDLRPAGAAFAGRRLAGIKAMGVRAIEIDFSKSLLTGANFRDADLRGADFSYCDLRGVSFRNSQLSFANFTGVRIGSIRKEDGAAVATDFGGATTIGATFDAPIIQPSPAPLALALPC
jgi:uncharacterized protein YjbI with pentapeptide repeats